MRADKTQEILAQSLRENYQIKLIYLIKVQEKIEELLTLANGHSCFFTKLMRFSLFRKYSFEMCSSLAPRWVRHMRVLLKV